MNDDDLLLATAYLDGELDGADRARVEGDPELLAAIEQQRQVRALLADVETPSIARREAHLAAALDAWDRLPAATRTGDGTPTGVAAISTPPPRERRNVDWNRRLLGAAAALVVVVGAGVALQTFTAIDDDGDSGNQAIEATAGDGDDAEDAPVAESDERVLAGESAPAAASAEADLAADTTIDVGSDNASPPRQSDLEQLRNADDLAIFASDAIGAPVADGDLAEPDVGDTPLEIELPLCLGADLLVGPARYQDEVVVVGIDEGRRLALAYLPDGCVEVARATVPVDQP